MSVNITRATGAAGMGGGRPPKPPSGGNNCPTCNQPKPTCPTCGQNKPAKPTYTGPPGGRWPGNNAPNNNNGNNGRFIGMGNMADRIGDKIGNGLQAAGQALRKAGPVLVAGATGAAVVVASANPVSAMLGR